jgi:5-carboxymethyl-2-hydroxymuconate isomerase
MPHLVIEYSANLASHADIDGLCARLHETMLATGVFELGAIRVRAHAAKHYAVADRMEANAFADITLRIGTGRSPEDKKRTGEAIMAAARAYLAACFETPHFALSMEIREIDSAFSWRDNAMHARLRAG